MDSEFANFIMRGKLRISGFSQVTEGGVSSPQPLFLYYTDDLSQWCILQNELTYDYNFLQECNIFITSYKGLIFLSLVK